MKQLDQRLRELKIALDENTIRRNLSEAEFGDGIKQYNELKKQLEGTSQAGGIGGKTVVQGLNNAPSEGWSLRKTAADLGISLGATARAIKIAAAIEQHPELAGLRSGQAILAQAKRRDIEPMSPPVGQYSTIVLDPPWPIEKILREVRPNQVEVDYPVMSLDEIRALAIPTLAADSCHLYLWTTQRFLPEGFDCLKVWGFRYIFTMVWHKPGGFQPYGLPQYNCEFCIYARKGTPTFIDTKEFFTCFSAPRRAHSQKPSLFYDTVRRVSPGPRLDMFAREAQEDFESWGDETARFQAPQRNDHQCGATVEPCG